jgi:hypothetical protein
MFVDEQHRICLQSSLVNEDTQRYIQQRLSTDKSLEKWRKDEVIRQEIHDVLSDGAHGMYVFNRNPMLFQVVITTGFDGLYASLMVWGKCRNRMMLRKALASLPPTLDQTYDRIFSQ